MITGNSEFGRDLVKALGLEGRGVRSIELRVAVDEIVEAKVTMAVLDTQAGEIAEIVKRYQLVEKEE